MDGKFCVELKLEKDVMQVIWLSFREPALSCSPSFLVALSSLTAESDPPGQRMWQRRTETLPGKETGHGQGNELRRQRRSEGKGQSGCCPVLRGAATSGFRRVHEQRPLIRGQHTQTSQIMLLESEAKSCSNVPWGPVCDLVSWAKA